MVLATDAPVLVVDDDYVVVEILSAFLSRLGFQTVEFASDGKTALEMLKAKTYGLILSDLKMEPTNGLSLLRTIRGEPSLQHLPFILTTASAATEDIIAAKRWGADGYLVKPFTIQQLLDRILAIPNVLSRSAPPEEPQGSTGATGVHRQGGSTPSKRALTDGAEAYR